MINLKYNFPHYVTFDRTNYAMKIFQKSFSKISRIIIQKLSPFERDVTCPLRYNYIQCLISNSFQAVIRVHVNSAYSKLIPNFNIAGPIAWPCYA